MLDRPVFKINNDPILLPKEVSVEQDFKKAGVPRCYACIQWEGLRTYYPDKKVFKVSENREGNCRIFHKKVKGSHTCEHFDAVR